MDADADDGERGRPPPIVNRLFSAAPAVMDERLGVAEPFVLVPVASV